MKKCPYCQTKAVFVTCKQSKLVSLLTRIRNKWFPSARHLIGGEPCLRKRLTRSEDKRQLMGYAIWDFRHAVLHDTYITDEVREGILEHLDTALTENQYEETT